MLVDIISKLLLHKILHAGGFLSHAFVIVLRDFFGVEQPGVGQQKTACAIHMVCNCDSCDITKIS